LIKVEILAVAVRIKERVIHLLTDLFEEMVVQEITDRLYVVLAFLSDILQIERVLKEFIPGLIFDDPDPVGAIDDASAYCLAGLREKELQPVNLPAAVVFFDFNNENRSLAVRMPASLVLNGGRDEKSPATNTLQRAKATATTCRCSDCRVDDDVGILRDDGAF
jgi:hypothetical protein